ncbi:unnamed protein product [Chondrus crispus]|uniref:Uncharacterized protein n=1 Tax=Chondrus crispus TaxID=2769 RepID=R7QI96_CHOCR|nr:unnamed protein product [Chondrus crispus]CDF38242.1 unnamed protein product [Chondrus crispus]|eukprot:XP_005718127.1 unnamed protein product [Chondrus crispus]
MSSVATELRAAAAMVLVAGVAGSRFKGLGDGSCERLLRCLASWCRVRKRKAAD